MVFQLSNAREGHELMESLPLGQPNGKILSRDNDSGGSADQGTEVVRVLQYEVREGGDGDEVIVIPSVFIANRDSSFILLERMGGNGLCPD